jgi:pyruvate dehydrogenase E1 component alpha subunit
MTITIDAAKRLEMFERMLTIRQVEERLSQVYYEGKVPGSLDLCVGQEAVAVGACAPLEPHDVITSTHRGHGHVIAKGAELRPFIAEVFGRATGYCKGKGGSLHMFSVEKGFFGNGIVGGGIPLAAGMAFAGRVLDKPIVGLSFFGDGAAQQGQFHEILNISSLWQLPVIFLCENNGFAVTMRLEHASATRTVAERASAYGMPGCVVDGNDVTEVYTVVAEAAARARAGGGPTLIEARTYRVSPQVEGEDRVFATRRPYRTAEEVAEWRTDERDPIKRYEKNLRGDGTLDDTKSARIRARVAAAIDDAFEYALGSPFPEPSEALTEVFAEAKPRG